MDLLGKGGRRFNEFDRAYAAKVAPNPNTDPVGYATRGVPLSEILGGTDMYDSQVEYLLGKLAEGGAMASNIGSRYALPAGGVTLAGKGLYDVIGMLQGEED